jgi:hypothetical protein
MEKVNKKAQMRQNLNTCKMFLSNQTKYRVFYMKMARIFQKCTTRKTGLRETYNNKKFDLKKGLSKKGVEGV